MVCAEGPCCAAFMVLSEIYVGKRTRYCTVVVVLALTHLKLLETRLMCPHGLFALLRAGLLCRCGWVSTPGLCVAPVYIFFKYTNLSAVYAIELVAR